MQKYVVTERAGVGVKHDGKLYAPGGVIEADAQGMKALVEAGAVKLKRAKKQAAGAGAKSIDVTDEKAGENGIYNADGY